ncbi:hypothetical protein Misp01_27050 [Microtetraspora sp. NBRC 13810]|uniref:DUF1700 domain-containing protein n=1 Tax=Microtetraspora sp. NBRC 13810 TaxID=3030990 RepID=UPI00249FB4B6|nr:hypothetical protein [Microtetraspora sp. NBRC 13810]GLW07575.1 hypothetical protein Misp01_27050 [Microtetraspora sp. NBRC 13810]
MNPPEYAQAVRDALSDLPEADRDELLEDLDDHLAEVAAESDVPLDERLGTPEAYAAELRAAYEGKPAGAETRHDRRSVASQVRDRVTGAARHTHDRLLRLTPYRQLTAFLPELRPGWWVVRGYVIAALALSVLHRSTVLVPDDVAAWAFALGVVWVSVWLGRRTLEERPRFWWRLTAVTANAAGGVLLFGVLLTVSTTNSEPRPYAAQMKAPVPVSAFDGVYNLYPYAEDGTPLHGIRLYDQDGRPLTLDPEMYGYALDQRCLADPPLANEYPLRLFSYFSDVPMEPTQPDATGVFPGPQSICPSPSPGPASLAEAPPADTPPPPHPATPGTPGPIPAAPGPASTASASPSPALPSSPSPSSGGS